LGAEASAIFELDKRGYISGEVDGFVRSGEIRTQSWINVLASSPTLNITQWTWDGFYEMYLPAGDYNFTFYAWEPTTNQGYVTVSSPIHISDGQSTTGISFQLCRIPKNPNDPCHGETAQPIPEFNNPLIIAFSALVASAYVIRRRRRAAG